jgi:subtilisin family serine protease
MLKLKSFKLWNLVATLSLVLASFTIRSAVASQLPGTGTTYPGKAARDRLSEVIPAIKTSHRLIVELNSPPLSAWASISPDTRMKNGRLDFEASGVARQMAHLQSEQSAFIKSMQASLPSASVSAYINETGGKIPLIYHLAFNGMTVDPGEADRYQDIYLDYLHPPDLSASVPLINAQTLYSHPAISGLAHAGQGIKLASMDGGIHHAAPMFDGTGYSYPPGLPYGGLGLTANNNGKIIASRVYFRSWDPPTPGDENAWPGVNGISHGVHTASIAAGREVTADYLGSTVNLHGVAPTSWLMSYRVFYPSTSGEIGFYTAEGLAALEDILQDGADVLNNSWGSGPVGAGGQYDPLDQALINVAQAGVFVSMSAGNSGPGKGTTDHPSPDYISVAASTKNSTYAAGRFYASAPEPVDPGLQRIYYTEATFGSYFSIGEKFPFPYKTSISVNPDNIEGCNDWPAGIFTGYAAVIKRGTCEFGLKVLKAEQAGAAFVVIYNNPAGTPGCSNCGDTLLYMPTGTYGSQVTIPSIFIGNTGGVGLVSWLTVHPTDAELTLDNTAYLVSTTPDVIPSFSSRGPGVGNVLKPDITAPGVDILAQGYDILATGEARHLGYGQSSGTSMAAPHVAGAAALLRQIHPDWSNASIKSALMTTSKYLNIWNYDGTHAQPLDMGAGRLDLTHSADPGVILDPPSLSFGLVLTGTLPALKVTLTSVANTAETYSLSSLKLSGTYPTPVTGNLPGFNVTPSSISLAPGVTAAMTVTFKSTQGVTGDNQGYIVLDGVAHDAHISVWGRVTPAPTGKDVLIIQNDGSATVGFSNYLSYYTNALDELGLTYDVWNADAHYKNSTAIPEAAVLTTYDVIIYFTGDYWQPNGTFSYSTPLTWLDLDRLTEYANNGGIFIAMGQDLASVWNADVHYTPSNGVYLPFLYQDVLGGNWLQDSVTNGAAPSLLAVPVSDAPLSFQGISLELNQQSIDEIETHPLADPNPVPGWLYPYQPLLKYPGSYNLESGTIAITHRAQPSLEYPGVSYFGRSVYATFGLEGVDNSPASTSRKGLLAAFLNWAMDQPTVAIANRSTPNPYHQTTFQAMLDSNLPTTEGISYRWDFGDGSPFTSLDPMNPVYHVYQVCSMYTVRVEALDSWGNYAIGQAQILATHCQHGGFLFLPVIRK